MKTYALIFLGTITTALAEVSPQVLDRCNFGYQSMERVRPAGFRDTLAPDPKFKPRELCAVLFNDVQKDENYAWLKTSVAHLRIPKGKVRHPKFETPVGQCQIGALIYLRKHFIDLPLPAKYQMTYDVCKRVKNP